jgi:hypothetical protein
MASFPLTPVRRAARTAALALVAALLLCAAAGAASVAARADDVTWTVRTASNAFGAERTAFTYTIDPGRSVEDGLVVANRGDELLELGVYAADGFTTEQGQLDLLPAGEESFGVGAWVETDASRVTVAPGETATVPFTLSVPENATPGDYAGGIVTSLTQADQQQGVNVDRRLGIRISLRVGGALAPALAVEDVHVDWDGGWSPLPVGDATIRYTLHNTGNAALTVRQEASTAGPFGWFAAGAAEVGESPQILPGETWTETVTVPRVVATLWLAATVTATPIALDASGSTVPLTPVTVTANGTAIPWVIVLAVLAVVATVVGVRFLAKRRRAVRQAREEARVDEAVQRALAEARSPAVEHAGR